MRRVGLSLLGLALLGLAACSSDNGDGSATPTRTATTGAASTSTPTRTTTLLATIPATNTQAPAPTVTQTPSTSAALSGLVVLRHDLRASSGDAVGAPPAEWNQDPRASGFDRALSYAAWRLVGMGDLRGSTADDGRFQIPGLPPGDYELELSKSLNGNLVSATVSFTIGDDGNASLVVEIGQGLVRWTATHREDGHEIVETAAPNGTLVVITDGHITSIRVPGRLYEDADGDGHFETPSCSGSPPVWLCGDERKCDGERACRCAGSCPLCEDCPFSVCVPNQANQPYACNDNGGCAQQGDVCTCVSSCPECDDCAASVCVPSQGCDPVEITGIEVSGPTHLVLGQTAAMTAALRLSDGFGVDVTQLAAWSSSDSTVAAVDAWGAVTASAVGTAGITATLATETSEASQLEVVARPALRHIHLQNVSCYYPIDDPAVGPGGAAPRPVPDAAMLPPFCRQVVRIGSTIGFFALGEFDGNYYEDVTAKVTWVLEPTGIGEIDAGVFTAVAVGTTQLHAELDGVSSDKTQVRVVDQPTIVQLQIYPLSALPMPGPIRPNAGDGAIPCYDCGYTVSVLRGDTLPFQATAAYETGEWENVTARVTWSSTNTASAPISTSGVLTAADAGDTVVSAKLGEIESNDVGVRVVNSATLLSLSAYLEGLDRVIEKGDQAFLRAVGYYDVGFDRDVTDAVTWRSSNDAIGGFDRAGVFVGRSAGNVEVWAELGDVESAHLSFEVFQTSSLAYCDDNHINRAEWSDAFNRVVLETDCALYEHPDVSTLRFTVTEREHPGGIFDPCLDLYVYQGDRLVRTIREEGCGEPFLAPGAPQHDEAAVRYQTLAFWDLKDDRGAPVPPGSYTIFGRFYLYYDPVVSLNVVVSAPNGRIPCETNPCGNGCGIVRACGGEPPVACPEVCVSLCECPAGWGITPEGDCEPCVQECCPQGAACLPGTPTCEPPPVCCPAGQACIPELPPCEARCCPFGALCGPLDLPPCDCCDVATGCMPGDPAACEPPTWCCPKGALCILPAPPCEEDCCPPGAQCADDIVPCDQIMCCRADGMCDPSQASCN